MLYAVTLKELDLNFTEDGRAVDDDTGTVVEAHFAPVGCLDREVDRKGRNPLLSARPRWGYDWRIAR